MSRKVLDTGTASIKIRDFKILTEMYLTQKWETGFLPGSIDRIAAVLALRYISLEYFDRRKGR